jgi:hypothetical protein
MSLWVTLVHKMGVGVVEKLGEFLVLKKKDCSPQGHLASWLVCWLVGWLVAWLVGWLVRQ